MLLISSAEAGAQIQSGHAKQQILTKDFLKSFVVFSNNRSNDRKIKKPAAYTTLLFTEVYTTLIHAEVGIKVQE